MQTLKHAVVALLAAISLGTSAGDRPQLVPFDEDGLLAQGPGGARVEARLDEDFNGDGLIDAAVVVSSDESRRLHVLLGYMTEVDMGHDAVGEAALPEAPLGPAQLSLRPGWAKSLRRTTSSTGSRTASPPDTAACGQRQRAAPPASTASRYANAAASIASTAVM